MPSLLLLLAFGTVALSQTPSSSVLRLSSEELVSRSSLVIYGVVREIRRAKDNQEAIVQVEFALKGKAPFQGEVAVIFSPGIEDSPIFVAGERVLLFLTKTDSGQFQTVGAFQGKFSFGCDRDEDIHPAYIGHH